MSIYKYDRNWHWKMG